MTSADLAAIRAVARSYFDGEASPAHDWHHVQRVESLAERLLDSYPAADERTVRLAVLLHDAGRAKEDRGEIDDHAEWGAREARRVLADHGVPEERIEAVAHAISVHRYSSSGEPESLEAKICCDADNLDALGAVGIARCFSHGGELGNPMYDPDVPPPDVDQTAVGRTQFNHFHKKILRLPERMYTNAGREIAEDRRDYVEGYLTRFEREANGEL